MREICQKKGILRGRCPGKNRIPSVWPALFLAAVFLAAVCCAFPGFPGPDQGDVVYAGGVEKKTTTLVKEPYRGAAPATKNKSFMVSALGNPQDYGYTEMAFICCRDSDGAIVSTDWNSMGLGTISVSYGYTGWGLYTAFVNMQNVVVKDYTPYILIRTAELGLVPYGWNGLEMGHSGTVPAVEEVHNIPDAWYPLNSADSPGNPGYWVQMYIGAGFSWNHLQVQWRNAQYRVNCDMTGSTYVDSGVLSFINSLVLSCRDTVGTVPSQYSNGTGSPWFERKFRVTYDANGGTAETGGQDVTSEFLGWNNQTQLGLGWDGYIWGSARNTTEITNCGFYANTYGDLMQAFGYNPWKLMEHYLNYGVNEGRILSSNHTWANVTATDLYQPDRPFQDLTFVDGSVVTLRAVYRDREITLPNASRDGYVLDGWYDRGVYVGKPGDRVTVSSDRNLQARWEPVKVPEEKPVYTIAFDGNGATGGSMSAIEGIEYEQEIALPKNTFVNDAMACSFQGWTLEQTDVYAAYRDGETLSVKMLADEAGKTWESGAVITLYAVWDQFPVIDAQDRQFTAQQVESGMASEEELLRTAEASDREDGRLEPGIGLVLLNFSPEDLLDLGRIGWCTVTYQATDSVGNTVYRDIRVQVTDERITGVPEYVRFIDEENYDKTSHADGGLYEDSVWYGEEDYAKTLEETFARSASGTGILRYLFDRDEIAASKAYVKEQGVGNCRSDGALSRWMELFADCRNRQSL